MMLKNNFFIFFDDKKSEFDLAVENIECGIKNEGIIVNIPEVEKFFEIGINSYIDSDSALIAILKFFV